MESNSLEACIGNIKESRQGQMSKVPQRAIMLLPHLSSLPAKNANLVICKDGKSQLLRVDSRQITGGDTRQSAWRFPLSE